MLDGKSILITGGTGSFGHAFVRRLLTQYAPRRVIVLSRDEYKQDVLAKEWPHESALGGRLRLFLGDVRDPRRLHVALHDVDIVVHAAALKQVPALEYNPTEAVQTNVLGAMNLIEASLNTGVERILTLSTDKAVAPVNLYGMTKGCAEKLFTAANALSGYRPTRFACVRYGNVAGSRGSVIPLFRYLAALDKPLPITDPAMTRFWITLEQAVDFVLDALRDMRGGEVYVPKLPGFRVTDLATTIAPHCEQVVTGIRPGEKLHESLISPDELRTEEPHRRIVGQGKVGPAYTSDNSGAWLEGDALKRALEDV